MPINQPQQQNNQPTNNQGKSLVSKKLNSKIIFVVLGILFLAVAGFFVWQSYGRKISDTISDVYRAPHYISCQILEQNIIKMILEANYCQASQECQTIYENFTGQWHYVNKQAPLREIKQKIGEFEKKLCAQPDFISPPKPNQPECLHNQCVAGNKPYEETVTVKTDKVSYVAGETVSIIVSNNGEVPINIVDTEFITDEVILLEQQTTKASWQRIHLPIDLSGKDHKQVLPGENHIYKWEQVISPGGTTTSFAKALTGNYRFKLFFFTLNSYRFEPFSVYSNEFEIQPIKQEVVITTGKTEYQLGEIVQIELKNNLSIPIIVPKEQIILENFATLERLYKEKWEKVYLIISTNISPIKPLYPNESTIYRWDQKIYPIDGSGLIQAPVGIYRFQLKFDEGLSTSAYVSKKLFSFSNKFEIKEKVSQAENYCQKDEECVLSSYKNNFCCPAPCGANKVINKIHC